MDAGVVTDGAEARALAPADRDAAGDGDATASRLAASKATHRFRQRDEREISGGQEGIFTWKRGTLENAPGRGAMQGRTGLVRGQCLRDERGQPAAGAGGRG